MTNFEHLK